MIEEDGDAAEHFASKREEIERPAEAEWPPWAGWIRSAWQELRDDRFYGAMGGQGRIYFSAVNEYAARYDICGEAFELLLTFLRAIDDEYIAFLNERQKAESDKQK